MTEHELDTLLRNYDGAVRGVCRAILPGHPQDAEEARGRHILQALARRAAACGRGASAAAGRFDGAAMRH